MAACIRLRAHPRLTAVGRDARRPRIAVGRSSPERAARTTPQAAAIPIAGAPRTAMEEIASATSCQRCNCMKTTAPGSCRWSSNSR